MKFGLEIPHNAANSFNLLFVMLISTIYSNKAIFCGLPRTFQIASSGLIGSACGGHHVRFRSRGVLKESREGLGPLG